MAKLIIEVTILIVPDLYYSIHYSKSISKIITDFMMMNFDDPIINIFSIEEGFPFLLISLSRFLSSNGSVLVDEYQFLVVERSRPQQHSIADKALFTNLKLN